jgi:hypothetical protein
MTGSGLSTSTAGLRAEDWPGFRKDIGFWSLSGGGDGGGSIMSLLGLRPCVVYAVTGGGQETDWRYIDRHTR